MKYKNIYSLFIFLLCNSVILAQNANIKCLENEYIDTKGCVNCGVDVISSTTYFDSGLKFADKQNRIFYASYPIDYYIVRGKTVVLKGRHEREIIFNLSEIKLSKSEFKEFIEDCNCTPCDSGSASGGVTSFNDLEDVPNFLDINYQDDFSGDYDDLTNKPILFSGDYNDLDNTPINLSYFNNDVNFVTENTQNTITSTSNSVIINPSSNPNGTINYDLSVSSSTPQVAYQWYQGGDNMRVYSTYNPFTSNFTENATGDYTIVVPSHQILKVFEYVVNTSGANQNINGSSETIIKVQTPQGNTSLLDGSIPIATAFSSSTGVFEQVSSIGNGTTYTAAFSSGTMTLTINNVTAGYPTGSKISLSNLQQ